MMQSANLGERHDLALLRRLHPPGLRGILVQTQMCSAAMVVGSENSVLGESLDFSRSADNLDLSCLTSFCRSSDPWFPHSDPILIFGWRIWRFATSSQSSNAGPVNPNAATPTDCFGLDYCVAGRAGVPPGKARMDTNSHVSG